MIYKACFPNLLTSTFYRFSSVIFFSISFLSASLLFYGCKSSNNLGSNPIDLAYQNCVNEINKESVRKNSHLPADILKKLEPIAEKTCKIVYQLCESDTKDPGCIGILKRYGVAK